MIDFFVNFSIILLCVELVLLILGGFCLFVLSCFSGRGGNK